jgi:hypothetical protein
MNIRYPSRDNNKHRGYREEKIWGLVDVGMIRQGDMKKIEDARL